MGKITKKKKQYRAHLRFQTLSGMVNSDSGQWLSKIASGVSDTIAKMVACGYGGKRGKNGLVGLPVEY